MQPAGREHAENKSAAKHAQAAHARPKGPVAAEKEVAERPKAHSAPGTHGTHSTAIRTSFESVPTRKPNATAAAKASSDRRKPVEMASQQKTAALAAIAASDAFPHRVPARRPALSATPSVETADASHVTEEVYGPYVPGVPARPGLISGQIQSSDDDIPVVPLRSIEEEASTPQILPSLYDQRGKLVVPPPLKGSREILLHQNEVADRDGLDRIQNDTDLVELRRKKKLVALPASDILHVDERLPENRRYARPWTAQFLEAMARDHYARFHTALQVNSAVRTVEFQQRLLKTNGNAAPAAGETASPHLTGQAVDVAKNGLTLPEIAWMRGYLLPLIQQGKIDVEEEFQQSCFHISVYKAYAPAVPKVTVASAHHAASAGLASTIE